MRMCKAMTVQKKLKADVLNQHYPPHFLHHPKAGEKFFKPGFGELLINMYNPERSVWENSLKLELPLGMARLLLPDWTSLGLQKVMVMRSPYLRLASCPSEFKGVRKKWRKNRDSTGWTHHWRSSAGGTGRSEVNASSHRHRTISFTMNI